MIRKNTISLLVILLFTLSLFSRILVIRAESAISLEYGDNFESGFLSPNYYKALSGGASITIQNQTRLQGNYASKFSVPANTFAVYKVFTNQNYAISYVRAAVYFNATPSIDGQTFRIGPDIRDAAVSKHLAAGQIFYNGTSRKTQWSLYYDANNGTNNISYGTTMLNPKANIWYIVEVFCAIGNGNGFVGMYVNNQLVVNVTGIANNLYAIGSFEMGVSTMPINFALYYDSTYYSQSHTGLDNSYFTAFQITDTQFLASRWPAYFDQLTQWIVDSSVPYNLKMVIHTGDIVDNATDSIQWQNANNSMSLLLNNSIPYCWDYGNHDQYPDSNSSSIGYGNQYAAFNATSMRDKPYWVSDIFEGKNTAVKFSGSSRNFLVVNIENNANSSVLNWMQKLIAEHQNFSIIVATHNYINGNAKYDGNWVLSLKAILDGFPRVFLTLNGHVATSSGNRTIIGNRNELFYNFQNLNGAAGSDSARILTFDLASNICYARTFVIYNSTYLSDSYSDFQFNPNLLPVPPPVISNIDVSTTSAGATCTFSALWTGTVALNDFIFSTDNNGSWANDSLVSFSGNPSWANVTKQLTSTIGVTVHYEWFAEDSSGNWASSGVQTLTTTDGTPPVFSDIVASNTYAGYQATISFMITDNYWIHSFDRIANTTITDHWNVTYLSATAASVVGTITWPATTGNTVTYTFTSSDHASNTNTAYKSFHLQTDTLNVQLAKTPDELYQGDTVTFNIVVTRSNGSVVNSYLVNITKNGQLLKQNLAGSTFTDKELNDLQSNYTVTALYDNKIGIPTQFTANTIPINWLIPPTTPTPSTPTGPVGATSPTTATPTPQSPSPSPTAPSIMPWEWIVLAIIVTVTTAMLLVRKRRNGNLNHSRFLVRFL